MIEVQHLSKKYGSFLAVNSIAFQIPRGQIVGLLGHNGAGKTTTLKMITGYLEPSAGKILVDNKEAGDDFGELQKKIGYLSEQSPLYPEMTVWHYLAYVAELRGIAPAQREQAIMDAIRATELTEKASEYIHTLSKGYKQRVGVAQAIIHKPEILILDEPTNGLDPSQILTMRNLIKDLSKNATVILSTHVMQEVEAICDRVIIMMNGRIAVDETLQNLQKNNAIHLAVRHAEPGVHEALQGLPGFKSLAYVSNVGDAYHYRIETTSAPEDLAPLVAKTVFQKGWDLYQLSSERRDLETVFKEINRGIAIDTN